MTTDTVYYGLNTPMDGNKFLTNPRTLVCYVCGRQYGLNSYSIHLRQCKELWVAREGLKEQSERKQLPKDPTGGYDPKGLIDVSPSELAEINKAANETFNAVSLTVCLHCGRSFLNDKLPIHNKSCTATNPGRSVNKTIEPRPIQDSLSIPERKFNMPRGSPGPAKLTPTSNYDLYSESGSNSRRSSYDGRQSSITPPSNGMRSLSGSSSSRFGSEGRPKSVTSAKYESNSIDGSHDGRRKSITTLKYESNLNLGSSSCRLSYDGRPSSITPPKYGLRSAGGSSSRVGSEGRPKSITTPRRDGISVDGDSTSRLSYNGRPKSTSRYETSSVDGESYRSQGTDGRRKSITTPRRDGNSVDGDRDSKYYPDGRRKSITASIADGERDSKYGPDGKRKSITMHKYESTLALANGQRYGSDGRPKSSKYETNSVDGDSASPFSPEVKRKSITASTADGEGNERYGPDGRRKSITMHKYESTLAVGNGSSSYQRLTLDGKPKSSSKDPGSVDGNSSRRGSFTGSTNEKRRVSIIGSPSPTHTEEKSGYQDVIPEPQEAEVGAEDRVAEMESRVATMAETICEMKSRIIDLKVQQELETAAPRKEVKKVQHQECCVVC